MRIPNSGHQPTSQPVRTGHPGPPPAAASTTTGAKIETPSGVITFPPGFSITEAQSDAFRAVFNGTATPVTYEPIMFTRELGRGVTLTTAPRHSKIALHMLLTPSVHIREIQPGHLRFSDQADYRITGYDPADDSLTLTLIQDHRLTERTAAAIPESTEDLDVTPYLVVHRYRTDQGDWAWCYRCWGDAGCDGFLSLDWSTRETAEREARAHLAGHPAVPPVKEMAPLATCRAMETRTCPESYKGPCGDRPCARFESNDETPWAPAGPPTGVG